VGHGCAPTVNTDWTLVFLYPSTSMVPSFFGYCIGDKSSLFDMTDPV
jgi:hypothetical protein